MPEDQERKGWWQTVPGILTAAAGIITALTGLIAALHQAGIFVGDNKVQPQPENKPVATANLITGKWSGEAKDVNGTFFQVDIEIKRSCMLNEECGAISVSHVPCHGELFLHGIEKDNYEFWVGNFTNNSSSVCTPGAGEHFKQLPDGTLLYTTTYNPKASGILKKNKD
ncbi:MAG: hypothetical protein ACRERV_09600 [Methylococcales bacterium]